MNGVTSCFVMILSAGSLQDFSFPCQTSVQCPRPLTDTPYDFAEVFDMRTAANVMENCLVFAYLNGQKSAFVLDKTAL
jgi:hypothetical protein